MKDFIYLSSTPHDEPCVQVSDKKHYMPMMNKEIQAFKNMLERLTKDNVFGDSGNAYIKPKSEHHEFGEYKELLVYFDDDSEVETDYAFSVEKNLPLVWDEIARQELGTEYFDYIKNQ
jgi:hypothetical protein